MLKTKRVPTALEVTECPHLWKHYENDGSGWWYCMNPNCGATGIDIKSVTFFEDRRSSKYKATLSRAGVKGRAAATKAIRARKNGNGTGGRE